MVGRIGGDEAGCARKAGVVDKGVDAQAPRRDGLDQQTRRLELGQVGRDDGDTDAVRRGQFGGERLKRTGTARGQDQAPALFRIDPGQSRADPGGGARDQGGATGARPRIRRRQIRRRQGRPRGA